MKKIAVVLSLVGSMALAGDYYGGVNLGYGKGSTEQKNLGSTQTNDFSITKFGVQCGYMLNENSSVASLDFTKEKNEK